MMKVKDEVGEGEEFESRMIDPAAKYRSLLTISSYINDSDIHQVLEILEFFHQVELLRKPWYKEQYYKCSCADCHRTGYVIIASSFQC